MRSSPVALAQGMKLLVWKEPHYHGITNASFGKVRRVAGYPGNHPGNLGAGFCHTPLTRADARQTGFA